MADLTNKQKFLNSVYPYAVKSANILKVKGIEVNPLYIASQWAHETGYGSNTGSKNNNMAGMWAYPSSPYGINGKKYETMDDFIIDYSATLSNKRYAGIDGAGSVTDFASGLKAGGYATDPNYAYANTWTEAVDILSTEGATGEETSNEDPKWWQLYRTDQNGNKVVVSWKNFFLGTTIETKSNDDGSTGVVVRDNTKLDTDPSKDQTLVSADENWMDLVRLGFFQFLIFILVIFFLYGALIKGSTVDDLGKAGVKIATKGMI